MTIVDVYTCVLTGPGLNSVSGAHTWRVAWRRCQAVNRERCVQCGETDRGFDKRRGFVPKRTGYV